MYSNCKSTIKRNKIKQDINIDKGTTGNLEITYNTTDSKNVKWSTSDESVATIENGEVKAVGVGTSVSGIIRTDITWNKEESYKKF